MPRFGQVHAGATTIYQTASLIVPVSVPAGGRRPVTSEPLRRRQAGHADRRLSGASSASSASTAIDWGWFFFLTKPIFRLLHWLDQLIGNYRHRHPRR